MSKEAVSFMKKLLERDYMVRYKAEKALNDPWILINLSDIRQGTQLRRLSSGFCDVNSFEIITIQKLSHLFL